MPVQHDTLLESKHDDSPVKTIANDSPAGLLPAPQLQLPSVREATIGSKKNVQWNTANLGFRLGVDAISAASAAALIAPIITVIDRYVHEECSNIGPRGRNVDKLQGAVLEHESRSNEEELPRQVPLLIHNLCPSSKYTTDKRQ